MTNAERQQRWRDRHRPAKRRRMQWDAQGNHILNGQFTGPTPTPVAPRPAPTPSPAIASTATPEQNYCPHCGSCLRKRTKQPKLAA